MKPLGMVEIVSVLAVVAMKFQIDYGTVQVEQTKEVFSARMEVPRPLRWQWVLRHADADTIQYRYPVHVL